MGNVDKASKLFYSKPKNFISVVKLLYEDESLNEAHVEEISENLLVMAEQLMEGHKWQKREKIFLERHRDIVKKVRFGDESIIVGIENQRRMDYSEPARIMLYDAMEYDRQQKIIKWAHEEEKDLRGDEYIAGFARDDRLVPVTTIVIYYGKEPWKYPKRLSDIREKGSKHLSTLRKSVQDYEINVIDVRRLTDEQIAGIHSDVKLLFGYVKYDGNPAKLEKFVEENKESFKKLSKETYEIIAAMTETRKLLEIMGNVEEGGRYNMCKAIDDMVKEGERRGVQQGIQQGMLETCKMLGVAWDVAFKMLVEKFSMTEDEGKRCMELYW